MRPNPARMYPCIDALVAVCREFMHNKHARGWVCKDVSMHRCMHALVVVCRSFMHLPTAFIFFLHFHSFFSIFFSFSHRVHPSHAKQVNVTERRHLRGRLHYDLHLNRLSFIISIINESSESTPDSDYYLQRW